MKNSSVDADYSSAPLETLINDRGKHNHIDYEIHSFSSYSSDFHPIKIKSDTPHDQSNRWQAASADSSSEFILLELKETAILTTITFGKYHKKHAATVKDLSILTGLSVNKLSQACLVGMSSQTEPETFIFDKKVPIKYMKIVPQSTFESKFGFGIWFVELRGIDNQVIIERELATLLKKQYEMGLKLVLKHLRSNGFTQEFLSIRDKSQIKLESEHVTQLFKIIFPESNRPNGLETCEQMISKMDESLFSEYVGKMPYQANWEQLESEEVLFPDKRGGHQMVFDRVTKSLILFGGWDGTRELADLWRYETQSGAWFCQSEDTFLDGGPCGRSCHKIALHTSKRLLFVLGRFIDMDLRKESLSNNSSSPSIRNDFFVLDLDALQWQCISQDVSLENGPPLLFDHQMVVDENNDLIYVFGGKFCGIFNNATATSVGGESSSYGGFYVYDINRNVWTCLRSDSNGNNPQYTPLIRSRIGHSMVFSKKKNLVYILMGQRNKEFFPDFYIYSPLTDTVIYACQDVSRGSIGPQPGFTQRCCIDEELGEMYLLSGMTRETKDGKRIFQHLPDSNNNNSNNGGVLSTSNNLYVCNMDTLEWSKVATAPSTGPDSAALPKPRFAHQFCYDDVDKVFYLFGGNPGNPHNNNDRLGDFWKLTLAKPKTESDIKRDCIIEIRIQR
jgi:muskelin